MNFDDSSVPPDKKGTCNKNVLNTLINSDIENNIMDYEN